MKTVINGLWMYGENSIYDEKIARPVYWSGYRKKIEYN